jgi:flagellar M-ring protein FliF
VGFLKGAGAGRLALIFGVTAGVAAALLFLMARAGEGQQSLLYAGLTAADLAQVAQQLDQGGVGYDIGPDGGSIYVDRDQVAQARILVASESALTSGTVGYEIFDQADALGSTQFVQNVNALRALEGELARTIGSIQGVTAARVHLVLPERRLFERDGAEPTATVVVGLADPGLAASHARTIRNLVATATPGLQPSRVTVVDGEGRTLANGAGDEEEMGVSLLEDGRASAEERLRRKVLDALEPIVGSNGARVQVAAEIDLTRVSTSNETFDPDSQVVRSSTVVEESSNDSEPGAAPVSVSENLPDGSVGAADPEGATSETASLSETFNYEISRSTVTEVREAGDILRLSVAVAVDEARVVGPDGTATYRPRTEEELTQIAAVARAAVGYDSERGDVFEITSMPFERPQLDVGQPAPGLLSFTRNDILRFAEIGVMLIVGLALTVLVARPLAKGLAQPAPMLALAGSGQAAGGLPALAGPGKRASLTGPGPMEALPPPQSGAQGADDDPGFDMGALNGKLKASTVRRVSEVVEAHPEESLAILRTWMHER